MKMNLVSIGVINMMGGGVCRLLYSSIKKIYSGNGVHGVHGGAAGRVSRDGESNAVSIPRGDNPFRIIPRGEGEADFAVEYCCMC